MSNVQATVKSKFILFKNQIAKHSTNFNIPAATQLVTSLADQRKFNAGQITYLGRELMEKPKLEENFDKILRIDQSICIIDDMTKNDLCKSYDEHFTKLKSQGKSRL